MKHVYMLFAAIALEVTGTTFMKFSVMHEWLLIGYPVMLAAMACSYFCLSKSVKKSPSASPTPFGKAWPCGHGLMAWLIFNESMPPIKLLAFGVIIAGLIMIKKGTFKVGCD